ncbi:hypothetical protein [Streptomyces sp. NPDC006691]|uniref:hypothetical protein n=1 Tax=Streptomyces sp. NPDC006691 TaxID=3364757 RepID=UPI0036AD1035
MIVTLSAVALFGVLTVLLFRNREVGFLSALVLFLFGFFTAATGAAGPIRRMCEAILNALNHVA